MARLVASRERGDLKGPGLRRRWAPGGEERASCWPSETSRASYPEKSNSHLFSPASARVSRILPGLRAHGTMLRDRLCLQTSNDSRQETRRDNLCNLAGAGRWRKSSEGFPTGRLQGGFHDPLGLTAKLNLQTLGRGYSNGISSVRAHFCHASFLFFWPLSNFSVLLLSGGRGDAMIDHQTMQSARTARENPLCGRSPGDPKHRNQTTSKSGPVRLALFSLNRSPRRLRPISIRPVSGNSF